MGVGKTIQAIGITMCFRYDLPALIICPASIKMNWIEEICKLFKSISPDEVYIMSSIKDGLGTENDISLYYRTKTKDDHNDMVNKKKKNCSV
jgi:SNF2 family DNA or RNA helicase